MKLLKKFISVSFSLITACSLSLSVFGADSTTVNYSLSEKQNFSEKLDNAVSFFYDENKIKGDFDGNGTIAVTDARNILKTAAKLYSELTAEQQILSDIDCDGTVSVKDARCVLRIVAKLDTRSSDLSQKLELFNALVNSVKPSETGAIYYYKNIPVNITYDNQEAVNNFNSEIHDLANKAVIKASFTDEELNELKNMDLGEMLTDTENSDVIVKYKTTPYFSNRLSVDFPVSMNKKASLLTLNDIADIQYSQQDSTDFNIYGALPGSYNNVISGPYSVNGSSLTVYFNDEKVSAVPESQTDLSHGKAFNLNLDKNYSSSNDLQPTDNDEISTMGEFSGDLDSITYKNSYIKIYFNNNKLSDNFGKPIFADYHLNYTADIYTHIVMSMSLRLFGINIDINDYLTLSNEINEVTQYYFTENSD